MFWLLQKITRFYFIHPFFKISLCPQQGYFDFVVALGNLFRFTCWLNASRLEAWHIWWWRRIQQPSERRGWGRASLPPHRSRSQPRHPGNPLVKGRGGERRKEVSWSCATNTFVPKAECALCFLPCEGPCSPAWQSAGGGWFQSSSVTSVYQAGLSAARAKAIREGAYILLEKEQCSPYLEWLSNYYCE